MENRILVADDNPINRKIISSILDREGYLSLEAENGAQALELARGGQVDLVLLDIMMPELDGYGVCQALKQDPEMQDLPVMFMSSLDQSKDKVKGFDLGAEDYITKPYQQSEVLARVKRCLRTQRKERRLKRRHGELELSERRLLENVESAVLLQESLLPGRGAGGGALAHEWLRWPSAMPSPEMAGINRMEEDKVAAWITDTGGQGMGATVSALMLAKLLLPKPGSLTRPKIQGHPGYYTAAPEQVLCTLDRVAGFDKIDPHLSFHYLLLDTTQGLLKYANTGRPDPLLLRAGGEAEWLHGSRPPAGSSSWGGVFQGEVRLKKGDRIYLLTDGVTQAADSKGRAFGEAKAGELLLAYRQRPLREGLEALTAAVSSHAGAQALAEARTAMVLEYQP